MTLLIAFMLTSLAVGIFAPRLGAREHLAIALAAAVATAIYFFVGRAM